MNEDDLIGEALTEYFGGRCEYYDEGCPVCQAWSQYDALRVRARLIGDIEQWKLKKEQRA